MLEFIHGSPAGQEAVAEEPEHEFTLNAAGSVVTHADFGGGRPLCGWSADGEPVSTSPAEVTCGDCQAAQG